jgi:hypothetical protein
MAKQSFTTGQVLLASQMNSLMASAMLGGAASAKVANYTLVAADAGTAISMTSTSATTITVNTGFAAGDTVLIQNLGSGTLTITAGTATVNTSGNLTLGQYDNGILYFVSASSAIFNNFAGSSTGDITGVTAGTGMSGGGSSGSVTLTNSMATAIDAKGDLVVGTGADTFSRLAVGTNNHTLVADSAEATGLKYTNALSDFIIKGFEEDVNVVAAAATGTINFDVSTASVWYYTSNASANHTLNFRYSSSVSLNTALTTGDAITVVWLNTNGATAYYPNTIQIDGTTVTPKVPSAISSGNASAIDAYSFTIIKTASATFTVLETQTKFA